MRFPRFRPSTALVVACIALAVALGGTGYAAFRLPRGSVTSREVRDRSLLQRDFRRGQVPRGAEGPQGPQGPQGAQGIAGPAGPVTGDLPAQTTLRGAYAVGRTTTVASDTDVASISFVLRLSAAPTPHFIAFTATPPPECPGTVAAPEAKPGHLCVFEAVGARRTATITNPVTDTPDGASRYGAHVSITSTGAVSSTFFSRGVWAVTAQ